MVEIAWISSESLVISYLHKYGDEIHVPDSQVNLPLVYACEWDNQMTSTCELL